MDDQHGDEIPKRFLTYYERWGGYKQSPSGIALLLGVVGAPIAVMYLFSDELGDIKIGLVLLAACIAVLAFAAFAYLRQDRSFQRRMVAYDAWKRSQSDSHSGQDGDSA